MHHYRISLQFLSNWTLCITLLALAAGCSSTEPAQTQAVSSPSPSAVTQTSPSPTASATLSPQFDPFEQAIDTAISASTITQSAVSQDDWKLVTSQWQKAIALLKSVPASHPKRQVATEKIVQYQGALTYAQQQATKPQLPKSSSAKIASAPTVSTPTAPAPTAPAPTAPVPTAPAPTHTSSSTNSSQHQQLQHQQLQHQQPQYQQPQHQQLQHKLLLRRRTNLPSKSHLHLSLLQTLNLPKPRNLILPTSRQQKVL